MNIILASSQRTLMIGALPANINNNSYIPNTNILFTQLLLLAINIPNSIKTIKAKPIKPQRL